MRFPPRTSTGARPSDLGRLSRLAGEPRLRTRLAQLTLLHTRIANGLESERRLAVPWHVGREREYTVGLIDNRGEFKGRIDAGSDIEALRICFTIHDACSDLYESFELWDGPRLIAKSYDARSVRRHNERPSLTLKEQLSAVRTEEILLDSSRAIATSRKLLEAMSRLRAALSNKGMPKEDESPRSD
jgi:hypothetical protein